jgi:pantoate--beta-alanine ligase
MQVLKTPGSVQRQARIWKSSGHQIGLVPTMGYLHAGHLSLVSRARQLVGETGKVVLSIYVNPTQFSPSEDLTKYPRDFKRDAAMCRKAGVDMIFAPPDHAMYSTTRGAAHSTFVMEEELSRGMEGASRPGHFRGVTTIVAKLFNSVLPDIAVFGAKDYQQAAVIRRMVRDLNFPVRIEVAPTFREPDGLAMSSRNKFLQGELRQHALVLWHSIQRTKAAVRQSRSGISAQKMRAELKQFIESTPDSRLVYVEFFDPRVLRPIETIRRGTHMAIAAFIGSTRLIDNARL